MKLRITQKPSIMPRLRLTSRIRMAGFMELSEDGFAGIVREVESHPLFRKLASPSDGMPGALRTVRSLRSGFAARCLLELKDTLNHDGSPPDVEALVEAHAGAAEIIRRMGVERFERHFIYNEALCSPEAVAGACGISTAEAAAVKALVDDLAVRGEFYHPSTLPQGGGLRHAKIAAVERDPLSKGFTVHFFSPLLAAGRYAVDLARIETLKEAGQIRRDELPALKALLDRIELINCRKTTICRILETIVERQAAYLLSGRGTDLLPYTQTELARELGLDDSVVSRAIHLKSVELPGGEERAVPFFLPSRKDVRKCLIRDIVGEERGDLPLTDRQVQAVLRERYGIEVSRRTVNVCRHEA